ncbi:MAG: type IV secretory system conjugative DNA transfer family protein [Butyrivibrio sp.]|nr:type IV secretory system conjugative DNA transfer family protein [Butyrivibrio sp.]
MKNRMIIGKGITYSLDDFETHLNNNVLVVGASGTGKTTGIVIPNILQADGSYIISDPKGNLYNKYSEYLSFKGYKVRKLDFTHPRESAHYNFFNYTHSYMDIAKICYMLMDHGERKSKMDPFWEESAILLLRAALGYFYEREIKSEANLKNVLKLLTYCRRDDEFSSGSTGEKIFESHGKNNPGSIAASTFKMANSGPSRTFDSTLITILSKLGIYDIPEISEMTKDDTIDIEGIGKEKTAVFVIVSDTDRSLDALVNIFFTQAINTLCEYADNKTTDSRLPVPVRFILDDFATNCKIEEFPRIISCIRSRGISTMLMVQAESQLKKGYGDDAETIISNCDTYVYLGGNDIPTSESISVRLDVPVQRILNMPVGKEYVFRRGQEPVEAEILKPGEWDRDRYRER